MVGKIDLYRDLLSDFNNEINIYNLLIEVVEDFNELVVEWKVRDVKGVYLIEGYYNDYWVRLIVIDWIIYKLGVVYIVEKFGLIDFIDFC